jgi:hypothetical protein
MDRVMNLYCLVQLAVPALAALVLLRELKARQ